MITRWMARKAWAWLGCYMDRSSINVNSADWKILLQARTILLRAASDEK